MKTFFIKIKIKYGYCLFLNLGHSVEKEMFKAYLTSVVNRNCGTSS